MNKRAEKIFYFVISKSSLNQDEVETSHRRRQHIMNKRAEMIFVISKSSLKQDEAETSHRHDGVGSKNCMVFIHIARGPSDGVGSKNCMVFIHIARGPSDGVLTVCLYQTLILKSHLEIKISTVAILTCRPVEQKMRIHASFCRVKS